MKEIQKVNILIRVADDLIEYFDNINIDFENRKDLENYQHYEDGRYYNVSKWSRQDGKIDNYIDILGEALNNGLNPQLEAYFLGVLDEK